MKNLIQFGAEIAEGLQIAIENRILAHVSPNQHPLLFCIGNSE
jgi:hypothetical protein